MPHWHCHASNYQQTTDNKFLCRLQGTATVPFTAHALNRRIPIVARSNQKTKKQQAHRSFHLSTYQYTGVPFLPSARVPIHRCNVPTICPRTNTGVTFQPSAHVPIHRCNVPTICPQNIPANVFVLVLLLKTKFRDKRLEHILGHMFREKVCSISRARNLL